MSDQPKKSDPLVNVVARCSHHIHTLEPSDDGSRSPIPHSYCELQEGKPLAPGSEAFVFEQVPDAAPGVCHKRTIYSPHKGPARASSPAYRQNYDTIFGGKHSPIEA